MRNVLATLILSLMLGAAYASPGGEGNNTGCNGVGNPNSPCEQTEPNTNGGGGDSGATAIGVGVGIGVGYADADADASAAANADASATAVGINENDNTNLNFNANQNSTEVDTNVDVDNTNFNVASGGAGGDGGDASAFGYGEGGDAFASGGSAYSGGGDAYSEGSSAEQAQSQDQSQTSSSDSASAANNEGVSNDTDVEIDSRTYNVVDYDDYPVMPAPASFAGLCHGGAGLSERDVSLSVAQVERYCQRLQIADALYGAASTIEVRWPVKPVRPVNECGQMPSVIKGGATSADMDSWKSCVREHKAAMSDFHAEMDEYSADLLLAEAQVEEREFFLEKARETVLEADQWVENMAPIAVVSEVSRGLIFPAILVFAIMAL